MDTSSLLKEFAPVILNWAFRLAEEKLGEVKGGPWRVITPIVSEMLEAGQLEVAEHGIGGVLDEHGRLMPHFRAPFEFRILQVLNEFGFSQPV